MNLWWVIPSPKFESSQLGKKYVFPNFVRSTGMESFMKIDVHRTLRDGSLLEPLELIALPDFERNELSYFKLSLNSRVETLRKLPKTSKQNCLDFNLNYSNTWRVKNYSSSTIPQSQQLCIQQLAKRNASTTFMHFDAPIFFFEL